MAAVTIALAVTIHDTDRGVHRNFKNDWFVGLGSACVALGYAAKGFWIYRRNWRLWAVIAALFALFTAITIPFLSQMEKVPLLFMGQAAPQNSFVFIQSVNSIHIAFGSFPFIFNALRNF